MLKEPEMNISIKQSQLDYVNSEIEKKELLNFLPNVNVGGNHSWNVGLNQNITTGLLENITTTVLFNEFKSKCRPLQRITKCQKTSQSKFIFTSESISA